MPNTPSGVAVEDVDRHVNAAGHHLGGEGADGGGPDLTPEDEFDLIGTAEVEVVSDQCLEEGTSAAWSIEHQGAGGLDLAQRELPPVAGVTIGGGQRRRDDRHPAIEEALQIGWS